MKKILIIEDDESLVKELKELLQNSGYEAKEVKDFKNIDREVKEQNPDLLLLDINIPYINGNFLLQSLRKTSNIPVIMVTSKNSEPD